MTAKTQAGFSCCLASGVPVKTFLTLTVEQQLPKDQLAVGGTVKPR